MPYPVDNYSWQSSAADSRTPLADRRRRRRAASSDRTSGAFALFGYGDGLAVGAAGLVGEAAAVFGQKADQRVHLFEVGSVIKISTLAAAGYQPRVNQLLQMERQRGGGHVES